MGFSMCLNTSKVQLEGWGGGSQCHEQMLFQVFDTIYCISPCIRCKLF